MVTPSGYKDPEKIDEGIFSKDFDRGSSHEKSLKTWMRERAFSLDESLTISIKATECLREIHRQEVIHKDIQPDHLIYNIETKQLKFSDFGFVDAPTKEVSTYHQSDHRSGFLAYISPEQTGRLNRSVDYRYKSANGLKQDLEKCYQQLQDKGKMELFSLGQKDISEKFYLPEKLYGREK